MIKLSKSLRRPFSSSAQDYQSFTYNFETNWKQLANEQTETIIKGLEGNLSEAQKKRVDALARAYVSLNVYELRYLNQYTLDKCSVLPGMSLMTMMTDWPSLQKTEDGRYPIANPNYFLQQKTLAKMWPGGLDDFAAIMGSGSVNLSGSAQSGQAKEKAEKPAAEQVAAKSEEKVKEKETFELELVSFDQAQKIKVIKEVRQIFGLGLKEAKELVEKAPISLKAGVKKEDAENWKSKLAACGCVINMK